MKLHLPKGIRTALLACVCAVATTAWADELTGGTTYDSVTAGTYTTTGEGTVTLSAIYVNNGDVSITGTETAPVVSSIGSFNNSNTGSADSFVKSTLTLEGDVTVTLSDGINMSTGSIVVNEGATINTVNLYMCSDNSQSSLSINGGSLTATSGTTVRDAKGTISVSNGGTYITHGLTMNSAAEVSVNNGMMFVNGSTNLNSKGSTITVGAGGSYIISNGIESGGDNDVLKLAGGTFGASVWGVGVNVAIDVTADSTLQGTRYSYSDGVISTGTDNVLYNLNKAVTIESSAALNIEGDATANFVAGLTNNGTLNVNGGTTTFAADVTGSGAITVASGAKMTLNSGVSMDVAQAFTNNGTMNLKGTLVLSDTYAASLTGTTEEGYSDGNSGFKGTNTIYDLGFLGTGTYSIDGGIVALSDGTEYSLHADGTTLAYTVVGTDNDGIYYVNDDMSYSEVMSLASATNGVKVASGKTLTFSQSSESAAAKITLSGGTLSLSSSWGDKEGTKERSTVTIDGSGTITGGSNAIYTSVDGKGDLTVSGSIHLYGEVTNEGNIEVAGGVNLGNWWGAQDGNAALLKNTGDVTIAADGVSLNSGSSIANGGALIIESDASLAVTGSYITLNQDIQNYGKLTLNGSALVLTADYASGLSTTTAENTGYSDGVNGFTGGTVTTYTINLTSTKDGVTGTLVAGENASEVQIGDAIYTLTLNTTAGTGSYSIITGAGTDYVVNESLTYDSSGSMGSAESFTVSNGNTLRVEDGSNTLAITVQNGGKAVYDTDATLNLTLQGGELEFGNKTLSGAITVDGSATVKSGSSYGSTLTADISGTGDLTLNGGTKALSVSSEIDTTGTVTIENTVAFAEGATIGDNVTNVTVSKGATLNLTNCMTLLSSPEAQVMLADDGDTTTTTATDLTLKSGSTLIFGEGVLTLGGGKLIVEDGAIIDLSAWTNYNVYNFYEVTLFDGVSELVYANDGEGYVQIKFAGSDALWDNWLLMDEGTTYVYAIPEPTTATLSLLALAGLAMRRRRK